jgi:Putative beta-barrel porin-2, OmpL-like. bbp2
VSNRISLRGMQSTRLDSSLRSSRRIFAWKLLRPAGQSFLLLFSLLSSVPPCVSQQVQPSDSLSGAQQPMTGRDDSGSDRRAFVTGMFPEDQNPFLPETLPGLDWAARHGIRSFGWLDGGISSMSGASGRGAEAPVPNRFSNQLMLNAAWIALQRSTTEDFSWGFRGDFYAGSDAALLRSLNHFGPDGPRWGTEVRQAYLMLHTPILFRDGIDWTIGRINFPTGAETTLAPYQQLYSRGYFWIHGATSGTALLATLHADSHLDIVAGATLGYNTSFILRGRAPSYLARVLYHPASRKQQQFIATVYTGPEPLAAANGHVGSWQTLGELQVREVWTARLSQIYEVNYTADVNDPANRQHNSATEGAFIMTEYLLPKSLALHSRFEWYADPHGSRIAIPGTYGEATIGLTVHPKPWLEFRPELRGDFSGQNSFGSLDSTVRHRNQLGGGIELLIKGRLF